MFKLIITSNSVEKISILLANYKMRPTYNAINCAPECKLKIVSITKDAITVDTKITDTDWIIDLAAKFKGDYEPTPNNMDFIKLADALESHAQNSP